MKNGSPQLYSILEHIFNAIIKLTFNLHLSNMYTYSERIDRITVTNGHILLLRIAV
jgi:hypothetical protein